MRQLPAAALPATSRSDAWPCSPNRIALTLTVSVLGLAQVAAVDASGVELKPLDISKDSVASMAETIKGADSLIIAAGFAPGANPLKWDAGFLAVDNVGTIALIDAAKAANVRKVVLVTSILTDAGAWGQLDSPGYQGTNVLGHCLEQKLVAEKYLKKSGVSPSHTILL